MEQALETLLKTRGLSPRGTLRALGGEADSLLVGGGYRDAVERAVARIEQE
ncbi:hypothetical protein HOP51_04945 [Halomonas sp. MCCC 1A11036]|uniref:Uncharacterized protein n=1 Tax=Billgrantia zhangzhouensis TaxID=2733481 RepID=A0ABS9AC40_9GAMM|nr:hypothetical protein [Halomonas zhangzhouensis]MCE8019470.1 hypothetical protein [Halomonas zhangzhouensis]